MNKTTQNRGVVDLGVEDFDTTLGDHDHSKILAQAENNKLIRRNTAGAIGG